MPVGLSARREWGRGYYCLDLYNLTSKLETLKQQHRLTDTNSGTVGADAEGKREELLFFFSSPIVSANKVILLFYLSHCLFRGLLVAKQV